MANLRLSFRSDFTGQVNKESCLDFSGRESLCLTHISENGHSCSTSSCSFLRTFLGLYSLKYITLPNLISKKCIQYCQLKAWKYLLLSHTCFK